MANETPSPGAPAESVSPGTHLVREWNGRTYQVEVVDNGYRFDGKTYPSLTAITKQITGTHWSGPRFFRSDAALLHGPEQIADLPVPVAESPGAVRIGHPERSHLVEYLAPNSVFNSLPRQRSSPHLRPDDRLVTIDRVLHHASLGVA